MADEGVGPWPADSALRVAIGELTAQALDELEEEADDPALGAVLIVETDGELRWYGTSGQVYVRGVIEELRDKFRQPSTGRHDDE